MTDDDCTVCDLHLISDEDDIHKYIDSFVVVNGDICCRNCNRCVVYPLDEVCDLDIDPDLKIKILYVLFQVGECGNQKSHSNNVLKVKGLERALKNPLDDLPDDIKMNVIHDYVTIVNKILRSSKRTEALAALTFYNCIHNNKPLSAFTVANMFGITKADLSRGCNLIKGSLNDTMLDPVKHKIIKNRIYSGGTLFSQISAFIGSYVDDMFNSNLITGIDSNAKIAQNEELKTTHKRAITKCYNAIAGCCLFDSSFTEYQRITVCAYLLKAKLGFNRIKTQLTSKEITCVNNIAASKFFPAIKQLLTNNNGLTVFDINKPQTNKKVKRKLIDITAEFYEPSSSASVTSSINENTIKNDKITLINKNVEAYYAAVIKKANENKNK